MLPLAVHVSTTKDGSCHGYKGCENRQIYIKGVNKEKVVACQHRSLHIDLNRQCNAGQKCSKRAEDIYLRRKFPVTRKGKGNC